MKKLLFILLAAVLGALVFEPTPVFCVYCSGGTPCYSDVDCSQGCRCQAPPYYQGVCIQAY